MRKALLVLLLPVVWLPLIVFVVLVAPAVPWWSWLFGMVFWVLLWRRRRGGVAVEVDPDGARYSPVGSGGGF